jgi:hypothetical protein
MNRRSSAAVVPRSTAIRTSSSAGPRAIFLDFVSAALPREFRYWR